MPQLDIVICTYEREELLIDCIDSLSIQDRPTEDWNIIIVNNSKAKLKHKTVQHLEKLSNLVIINEPQPGLSIARNTGIRASHSDWIGFLDDDATAPIDYINRIFQVIKNEIFDCFGGHIKSWWKYGRPRWLEESFGSKPLLKSNEGIINEGYNWGSNIIISRAALDDVGLFPTDIGMKGHQIGYAAENIVQKKMREKGYKIGYDPSLYINHVVMDQKLKLMWHIKAAYATGRDGRSIFPKQYNLLGFVKSFKNCFSRPIKSIYNLIFQSGFYWENAVLESLKQINLLLGKIVSLFKQRSQD